MGWRGLHFVLVLSLIFGPVAPSFAGDDKGSRNIRLRDREPGLYLTPKADPLDPEAENFSTTQEPVIPLDLEQIKAYLIENPIVANYKIALIGPALRGDQAEVFKKGTEEVLKKAGIETDVQVIRHPKTLLDKLTNIALRQEDYETPSSGELKVAAFKIFAAESLSFAVLLIPPILLLNQVELNEQLKPIVEKIALPLGTAVAMSVLDVAHMVPLISYRRTLSNWNIRLSPTERFIRQFVMSMFFSFNFSMVSQAPQIWEYMREATLSAIPADVLSGALKMGSVIVPASIFNMLSRTTVGTAQNIWEQREAGRRTLTSFIEALTGLVIAPVYILSTMPVLPTLTDLPLLDLNAAHWTMLGIGGAGGLAWAALEQQAITSWFVKTAKSCGQALQRMNNLLFLGKKDKLPSENADRQNQSGE